MPRAARLRACVPAVLVATVVGIVACRSGSTSVVGPTGSKCEISVTNETPEVPAAGGNGRLIVAATRECSWSAATQAAWINLSVTSGQGEGTVTYSVLPNPAGTPRRGRVVIAEQTIEVAQAPAPCRFEASPVSVNLDASGGEVSIGVQGPDGCPWTSRSDAGWIGDSVPREGTGSATIRFNVVPNTTGERSGTVTIADAAVHVRQAGRAASPPPPAPPPPPPAPTPPPPAPTPPPTPTCSYRLSDTTRNVGPDAEEFGVGVTTPAGCAWTVSSDATWIRVVDGHVGSGNGSFHLAVAANTGAVRAGTVRVATQTLRIQQAAGAVCTYAIKPTYYNAGRGPDDIDIAVTADAGCAWTATSPASWVAVVEGQTGSGNGRVRLLVQPNTGAVRFATLTIAGQPFELRQLGPR
jgi:Putative binding domain, N-terminal